ncbi:MAG: response regulator [Bdellovibrionales bacterium]|nr:response regulator [Bdellovibrionales bacterium]
MEKEPTTLGVLIVEDHMGMRKIIKTVLQALGVRVIFEAGDGAEALSILRNPSQLRTAQATAAAKQPGRLSIDIIICDWAMPKVTGIEVLEAVKKDAKLRSLPFIMLTAENTREQILLAMELGVTDYIIKPFTAATLEAKLRLLLASLEQPTFSID